MNRKNCIFVKKFQDAHLNMIYYKFVCVFIITISLFSIPYTNGINNNYIKMFPKIGENVTLKCGSNNIKNSDVLWTIKHKEIPGRTKVLKNGDLFIPSFNLSDAGVYICDLAAANGYADHAPLTEFELKPISIPGSLIGVKVIPNTVLVLITWRQIENNDEFPVKNITIKYKIMDERNSRDDWSVLQVNPSKISINIYSLLPNTLYKIQIWASNEVGNGPKTELTTKTLSDMTESELEKHLLEGIDTFDTRAWTFAVIVIMSTFSIFVIALCCLFVKDPRVQKRLENSDDVERIELIPNIIINPGYCET
ncbi:contactin-1 isoform X1 [Aphis gossypii]|uniref:Uncharacterized protein n=2 Tax=Aphis gossypii TaxID=80765 RepID=A0A9P0NFJ5_APHGO|nr:contactin-1 isoform X1 [Aphis gossypii]CAH1724344.1 unnamed protein product [Aphis gossypii]